MKDTEPIIDSSADYLDKKIPSGDEPSRRVHDDDYADLVTLDKGTDSWLENFIRSSWLKYFFMVRHFSFLFIKGSSRLLMGCGL